MFEKEHCINAERLIIKNNYSKCTLSVKSKMFISV